MSRSRLGSSTQSLQALKHDFNLDYTSGIHKMNKILSCGSITRQQNIFTVLAAVKDVGIIILCLGSLGGSQTYFGKSLAPPLDEYCPLGP